MSISVAETIMPWLLALVPIGALMFPGKTAERFKRALVSLLCVLVIGLGVLVGKVMLSAKAAKIKSIDYDASKPGIKTVPPGAEHH